jgi:RNA polymerase sigma-70 factor (ECF subfamily)
MPFHRDPNNITDDELYNELFTPLFKYVYFRVKDYDLATDLTQSSFLKFLTQEKKPVTKDHSLRLLFTISRNLLIDHWRTEGRHKTESIEGTNFEVPSNEPNPEKVFENNEDVKLIKKLMNLLSEIEVEIVTLRMTNDMDYKDIGELLNIQSVNARQIYSRALHKIQKSLEENNILNNI